MATVGVKVELEGAKAFSDGMKNLSAQTKLFDTEIKNIQKSMSKSAFGKSKEESEALKGKISALKDESALLSKRIEDMSAAYGENDTRVVQLKQKYEALQGQISQSEDRLKELGGTFGAIGSQLDEIGNKLSFVGDKFSSLGQDLTTKVTLPIVALGTKATMSFAEVDKIMALTNATMGNTEEQAKALNDAMSKAASNSTFGMSDAANATLNFARAGLDATQAASALAPAMNLAAGEGGDLNTVSAGLVATINGFQDSFDKTSYYADVFAAACNNSALDVNSLAQSMSIAAPIFSTAGYSIKDASLYMGVMANNGIEASVAANSLKSGIARLAKPTSEAQDELDRLGLQLFNTDGSMKSSIEVQKQLHDAFADLSEQEQIAAASTIFGKNQMASWLALINTAPQDVWKLNNALVESAGTTDEMSEAMMSGFGGSIEKLKSSVDVLMTTLGGLLADYIQPIIDKIQVWVDKFQSLDDETKQHIINVALVIAAIGPVLLIIGKIITGIASVISAMGIISTFIGATLIPAITTIGTVITGTVLPALASFGAFLAPLLPIIAAVVASIALVIAWFKNWGAISDWISEKIAQLKDFLVEHFGIIGELIAAKVELIWTIIKAVLDAIHIAIETVLKVIKALFRGNFNEIGSIVSDGWNRIKQTFSNAGANIKNIVSNLASSVISQFKNLVSSGITWGRDMIQNFINGIMQKWEDLKNTVKRVANTVKDYLGFSEPSKGPLSNFHTFGPDMMMNYAEGIKSAQYLVKEAVEGVALDVNSVMTNPIDAEEMYNAVREGAASATHNIVLNDREVTRALSGMGVAFV